MEPTPLRAIFASNVSAIVGTLRDRFYYKREKVDLPHFGLQNDPLKRHERRKFAACLQAATAEAGDEKRLAPSSAQPSRSPDGSGISLLTSR
mmetsp:Transcript_22458/g.53378  ORF Transcript_22458/g.53378 Transcript_22458/m.53378 type:complete len:92 (+) Transcript_22458:111-386(+)